jgi:hypothetical protein
MRGRSRLGCNAGARKGSAGSSDRITEGVVETSPGRVANLRQQNGDRRRRTRGTRWLEERLCDRGPTLEEAQATWGRMAERARAKLRGEAHER